MCLVWIEEIIEDRKATRMVKQRTGVGYCQRCHWFTHNHKARYCAKCGNWLTVIRYIEIKK